MPGTSTLTVNGIGGLGQSESGRIGSAGWTGTRRWMQFMRRSFLLSISSFIAEIAMTTGSHEFPGEYYAFVIRAAAFAVPVCPAP